MTEPSSDISATALSRIKASAVYAATALPSAVSFVTKYLKEAILQSSAKPAMNTSYA